MKNFVNHPKTSLQKTLKQHYLTCVDSILYEFTLIFNESNPKLLRLFFGTIFLSFGNDK